MQETNHSVEPAGWFLWSIFMTLGCRLNLFDLYFCWKSRRDLCVLSQQGSLSYACSYSYIHMWELRSTNTLCHWAALQDQRTKIKSKECGGQSALAAQLMSSSSSALMNMEPLLSLCCLMRIYKILCYSARPHFLWTKPFYSLQPLFLLCICHWKIYRIENRIENGSLLAFNVPTQLSSSFFGQTIVPCENCVNLQWIKRHEQITWLRRAGCIQCIRHLIHC